MFLRSDDAYAVALEVLDLGSDYGHASQECSIKQDIWNLHASTSEADTLGGWILVVDETNHRSSLWSMAFMVTHWYLRELFPKDILDDMTVLAFRDPFGSLLLQFVFENHVELLPEQCGFHISSLDPEVKKIFETGQYSELPGNL